MDEERIYTALRAVVGRGGSADDDSGLEGLWRRCRARGIAAVAEMAEQGALEALPDHAEDLLPYYERLFRISVDESATENDRRAEVALRYTSQDTGALPELAAWLQRIDPRFSVLSPPDSTADTTIVGRAFDDLDEDEPFDSQGPRRSTAFPNHSTRFTTYVLFDLGNGVLPNTEERRAIALAHKVLGDGLPAPCDYQIATADGFVLDVSRLDLTAFGA